LSFTEIVLCNEKLMNEKRKEKEEDYMEPYWKRIELSWKGKRKGNQRHWAESRGILGWN
jgi:hypothetical protein